MFCIVLFFFSREELYRQFYVHRMRMGDPTAMLAPEEVFRSEEGGNVRDEHRGGNGSGVVMLASFSSSSSSSTTTGVLLLI